jgi:opine dehydrogenase
MNDEREALLTESLRRMREKGRKTVFCVIGAGHGGLAMAGHLGIMGFPVSLYNRTGDNLNGVRWHGGVKVSGAVEGFGPVRTATTDINEAITGADVIMVVTPATAHRSLAEIMAPHLVDGQMIILNPGRTGGALEFRAVLLGAKAEAVVVIAETQTFLYTSRAVSRSEGHIYRVKNAVPLATLPAYWIPDTLAVLNQAFPCFIAGNSVLSTSIENIGAVFHPALTILNSGWIEATGGDFDYYLQGITPSIAMLLEKVDAERIAVATGLGLQSATAREWLYRSYDSSGRNLHEAIQNTVCYAGIKAPPNIAHRYIFEDVPMSLVPIASIGALLGIATPTIDMVINLGSILHGRDFRAEGRTVARLGLAGLSLKQIHRLVMGVEDDRLEPKE